MKRRRLLAAFGLYCLLPSPADAQPQTAKRRVGFFYTGSRQSAVDTGRYRAFLEGMKELGYSSGRDYVLEERFADGKLDSLAGLAKEILQTRVDVVVASGSPIVRALRDVTATVPIVLAIGFDPVGEGFAASLARPGGNVTGLSGLLDDIFAKHVEVLKSVLPRLTRLAVLMSPGLPEHVPAYDRVVKTADKLGISVFAASARETADIEAALASAAHHHAQAMIILGNAIYVQNFREISKLATKYRMATIYSGRELPQAGGLMSYGPNFQDNFRRAASFVDRILKGASPAELPFEQPSKLELSINMRTAKAIGIEIPKQLQLQADNLIE